MIGWMVSRPNSKRALYELEPGQLFLTPITEELAVLLLGYNEGEILLGRQPPSLPIARVVIGHYGYYRIGCDCCYEEPPKLEVLGSNTPVKVFPRNLDGPLLERGRSPILDAYKICFGNKKS